MQEEQLEELLLQALETELGGVQVYEAALACAQNDELRDEWEKYRDQTRNHVEVVRELLRVFEIDPERESPGRDVVRQLGRALVEAIHAAESSAEKDAAQLVAAECVVLAESKDHLNWQLLGEAARKLEGEKADALREAHEKVEEEEDEHLYHSSGWARELWIETLGMPAVLPPPEEEHDVKTAIGAARAKLAREKSI
jgi:hypothetical protein